MRQARFSKSPCGTSRSCVLKSKLNAKVFESRSVQKYAAPAVARNILVIMQRNVGDKADIQVRLVPGFFRMRTCNFCSRARIRRGQLAVKNRASASRDTQSSSSPRGFGSHIKKI